MSKTEITIRTFVNGKLYSQHQAKRVVRNGKATVGGKQLPVVDGVVDCHYKRIQFVPGKRFIEALVEGGQDVDENASE